MTKTSEPSAPHAVSDELKEIRLTGCFFPWYTETDEPVLMGMPGTNDRFLACFSTVEKLQECCSQVVKDAPYKIKHIDDGPEMLSSLPYWLEPGIRLRVILDPWRTETGTTRFKEVLRADA